MSDEDKVDQEAEDSEDLPTQAELDFSSGDC